MPSKKIQQISSYKYHAFLMVFRSVVLIYGLIVSWRNDGSIKRSDVKKGVKKG